MDTDFIDLGTASDVADVIATQNLLHYSPSLPDAPDDNTDDLLDCSLSIPDATSLTTPQSMDQECHLLHMESNYMDSLFSALGHDSADGSDHSVSAIHDSNLNLAGLSGFSAIHLAAYFGKLSAIRTLLSVCPEDVDLLNHNAQTPLHMAAFEGHEEVVPELLNSGANALLQDIDGRTALHLAVSRGNFDIVRLLLDNARAPLMIRMADCTGKTPLHQAVMQECDEIVRLLVERGADPRTPVG